MIIDSLINLLERELGFLKKEIEAYPDESQLWQKVDGINNSAGNLALHLCGNLSHFIGATLGQTGYIRDRNAEFSLTNVPRTEILTKIDETQKAVINTLSNLDEKEMEREYPIKVFKFEMSTAYFMMHLVGHFDYHLGQINYHRRILTNEK